MLPLGNALLVVASLVPDPDPGHSTGRSHDVENVLLTRLEKQIADKAAGIPPVRTADDQAFGGLRFRYSMRMRRISSMPSSVKASTPSSSMP